MRVCGHKGNIVAGAQLIISLSTQTQVLLKSKQKEPHPSGAALFVCYNIVMHRNIVLTFGILAYSIVAAIALHAFDFGLLSSGIIMFGLPTFLLAHYSASPKSMLVTVTTFGFGIALILETVGYFYGLWFIQGAPMLRLFGVVPTEILIVSFIKILFIVLLYELLFDDGEYSQSRAQTRFVSFGLFAVASSFLLLMHLFVFNTAYTPMMYYWLASIFVMASFAMIAVSRYLTLHIVQKVALFSLIAAIPLLSFEALMAANGFKMYIEMMQPFAIPFSKLVLPFGEVVLALTLPAFVTTAYELYLDDQS